LYVIFFTTRQSLLSNIKLLFYNINNIGGHRSSHLTNRNFLKYDEGMIKALPRNGACYTSNPLWKVRKIYRIIELVQRFFDTFFKSRGV